MTKLTEREATAVYLKNRHILKGYCRRVLQDPVLAEDAVQQVFVRLLRYADSYRKSSLHVAWLLRAASQVCKDLHRKRKNIQRVEGGNYDGCAARTAAAAEYVAQTRLLERQDMLREFLDGLGSKERQLAIWCWLDGRNLAEVCDLTGWSRSTVIRRLRKVEKRARRFSEVVHAI